MLTGEFIERGFPSGARVTHHSCSLVRAFQLGIERLGEVMATRRTGLIRPPLPLDDRLHIGGEPLGFPLGDYASEEDASGDSVLGGVSDDVSPISAGSNDVTNFGASSSPMFTAIAVFHSFLNCDSVSVSVSSRA